MPPAKLTSSAVEPGHRLAEVDGELDRRVVGRVGLVGGLVDGDRRGHGVEPDRGRRPRPGCRCRPRRSPRRPGREPTTVPLPGHAGHRHRVVGPGPGDRGHRVPPTVLAVRSTPAAVKPGDRLAEVTREDDRRRVGRVGLAGRLVDRDGRPGGVDGQGERGRRRRRVAGRVRRHGREVVRAVGQGRGGELPVVGRPGSRGPQHGRAVGHRDHRSGLGGAGQGGRGVVGQAVARHAGVVGEAGDRRGSRGGRVDDDGQGGTRRRHVAGRVRGPGGERVRAVGQDGGVERPAPVGRGDHFAEERLVVEDADRGARLGRPGERQRRVVGDVVGGRPRSCRRSR